MKINDINLINFINKYIYYISRVQSILITIELKIKKYLFYIIHHQFHLSSHNFSFSSNNTLIFNFFFNLVQHIPILNSKIPKK